MCCRNIRRHHLDHHQTAILSSTSSRTPRQHMLRTNTISRFFLASLVLPIDFSFSSFLCRIQARNMSTTITPLPRRHRHRRRTRRMETGEEGTVMITKVWTLSTTSIRSIVTASVHTTTVVCTAHCSFPFSLPPQPLERAV